MPHLLERAPTGRAKCRGCGAAIAKGDLRFGDAVPNPYADTEGAEAMQWYHPACAAYKRPEPFLSVADVTAESLADRDALVAAARLGVEHRRVARVDKVNRAATGRATCRACKTLIEKHTWRIALVFYEDGRFAPSGFIHLACAASYLESTDIIDRIRHFSPDLTDEETEQIALLLRVGGLH
jgi:ribosomal protein L37AE/L43A